MTATLPMRSVPRLHGLPWVTWRQHRAALGGIAAVLGGLAAALLVNGLVVRHGYSRLGLDGCGDLRGGPCRAALSLFLDQYSGWAIVLPRILAFLPGCLGMFLGAPLVARELESGSFRFAWTQGRGPVEWLIAKLALLGAGLVVLTLAFSAWVGWWAGPWLPLMGRMIPGQLYEISGVVFAARALFGFALGALLGTILRRTLPAMAVTGLVWVGVVWSSALYLRPLIQAPVAVQASSTLLTRAGWTVHAWVQNPAGRQLDVKSSAFADLVRRALSQGATESTLGRWLTDHHWVSWASYEPADRFWHFQAIEAAVYALLALVLAVATVAAVRRRSA